MDQSHFQASDFELPGSPILLIDDNVQNLALLQKTLEWNGFNNIRCCQSGIEGLLALEDFKPHLIILDLRMPGMDGFGFLEAMNREPQGEVFIPVLVFTADLTPPARNRALSLGASDFLTKPGDAIEIKLRVRNFLRMRHLHAAIARSNVQLTQRVRERTVHLEVARLEAIALLARAGEYRDDETGHHSQRVGELSASIALELGLNEPMVNAIRLGAPLHDIGKIAIPDDILHKVGALTADEYAIMKEHVTVGGTLLSRTTSPLLRTARDIAICHHERWDGRGYHRGLAGENIPISARIVSVADTFDAITNERPYRRARSVADAMTEIIEMAGSQFDPAVVEALRRVINSRSSQLAIAA